MIKVLLLRGPWTVYGIVATHEPNVEVLSYAGVFVGRDSNETNAAYTLDSGSITVYAWGRELLRGPLATRRRECENVNLSLEGNFLPLCGTVILQVEAYR